ncbi:C repressor protein [Rhizobium phage 16-3]|uniref:Repressor protein C n=1 Tax=Rhizobium phage 16-3 TaxID=10704 RepID=RPC_BP163|nr:transcriptional repressor [Rhizobium phage 16-3]P15238.4 RecName: Full=Repressor protein C [Rhizobium phage 16-3]ABF71321.1 C repressor protein [Rhizobium phage 16-3]
MHKGTFHMSRLTDTLAAKLEEAGITQAELARRVGQSQQAINNLFAGRAASSMVWRELARELGIDEQEMRQMMTEAGRDPEKVTSLAGLRKYRAVLPSPREPFPIIRQQEHLPRPNATIGEETNMEPRKKKLLPVLGEAVGGEDGEYIFNGSVLDYVDCPPSLENVPNAYAVYIDGESMVPRFRPGETVWVHPTKPPRRGDDVVIQIHPDNEDDGAPPRGFVKEFVGWTANKLVLQQYNPTKKIEFTREQVVSVHPIILAGKYW